MLISWADLVEVLNDLDDRTISPRIQAEVPRGLDLNKQQGTLVKLDNKSNRKVGHFSVVWDDLLWTDIEAVGRREPIIQNLVIQRAKFCFSSLVVVVQLSGFG